MSADPQPGAIALERCRRCGHVWVLGRQRCPRCGAQEIERYRAAGRGRVHATTLVHRAPDETFASIAPYRIGLVDLDEGPRLMAHLRGEVAIGSRVAGRIETVAGRDIPVFGPDDGEPSDEPAT